MRISTAELFRNGIATIGQQQAGLAKTQQQLATGRRMLAPSDDPAGAVQALKLRDRLEALDQYQRNGEAAAARLGQQEGVLDHMGSALHRIRELTVAAANASQTGESRAAIARELRQLGESLLTAANTRDVNGEYLFGGFRSLNQPFVRDAQGEVQYLGDLGRRQIALAPDRTLAIGDSGDVFMSIPRGNGVFVATAAAGNTGTARVTTMDAAGPAAGDGATYTISFTGPGSYEVRDADDAVVQAGDWVPDQAIEVAGRRVVIGGTPAAGDAFVLEPAGQISLFAMVDELAAGLEAPAGSPAERAALQSLTDMGLRNVDQALGRVLEMRGDVGARLNAIEVQTLANEDATLQMRTMLSGIEDLDYAEAISRFRLQQVALEAAQQTYVQLGRLSLFNYLR